MGLLRYDVTVHVVSGGMAFLERFCWQEAVATANGDHLKFSKLQKAILSDAI